MTSLITITSTLLLPLYTAAMFSYGYDFLRGEPHRWSRGLLIGTLLVHGILIYAETVHFGHLLVYSSFEVMTLIAFMVAVVYFIIEITTRERGTGVFMLGISLLFQTLSQMFSPRSLEASGVANQALLSDAVGFHVMFALLGYTAFTVSAVYGGLYLAQYHEIKSNSFGLIYDRLPSLGLLGRMSAVAAVIGLVLLTVAIISAILWLPNVLPTFSYGDPKVWITIVIWLIYLIGVSLRYLAKVDQRKFVTLSLIGFATIFLSMTLINTLLTKFHDFR